MRDLLKLWVLVKKYLDEKVFHGKVAVDNFPEIQRVEVTNIPEPVEVVKVSNLSEASEGVKTKLGQITEELSRALKPIPPPSMDGLSDVLVQINQTIKSIPQTNLEGILSLLDSIITTIKESSVKVDLSSAEKLLEEIATALNFSSLVEKDRVKVILSDKQIAELSQSVVVSSGGGLIRNNSGVISSTNPLHVTGSGGGGDGAILDGVDSNLKATVKDLTNSNPLTVAIVDTSGNQIASFGGGTQYNEGDTPSPIVGTAALGETPTGVVEPLQLTPGRRLKVETAAKNVDDDMFAIASNDGYPVFGLANEAIPDSVDDGDVGALRMSLNRNLYTQIRDGAGNERSANVNANKELLVKHTDSIPVTQSTAANLNATVVQGTAANLKTQAESYQGGSAVGAANPLQVSLANTGANATALKVDGSAVTQPVSGTVTAQQSTAANLNATVVGTGTFAVQAAQSGNWSARTQDGAGNNLESATASPAGTERGLIVRNIPSGTQTVSGTVTANAGTNLNTSALALEAGNLASIKTNTDKIPSLGQATMANSVPVAIASDQSSVPVSVSGVTDVNLLQLGGTGTSHWSDSSSEGDGGIIALGVRNDNAATIVNANLDYAPFSTDIAGRVGVSDLGGSLTVDGTVTAATQTTTAGTPAGVTVSTSSVQIVASNANRRAILITNNGAGDLYIGHTSGVTSSGANMGLLVRPGGVYQDSGHGLYTGALHGIYSITASVQNVSYSERT